MDFVLTSDLDWASEFSIEYFLEIARKFSIKPTLFITHPSEAAARASNEGRAELAVHPNFLPDSTHGGSIDTVADHVLALAPGASAWRCHRYVDSQDIRAAMTARGLWVDSNVCLHLQPEIAPQYLPDGTLRLPVFFEDDVHWGSETSWSFADHAAKFRSRGLKILNFHPFFVALNLADAPSYARVRPAIRSLTRDQAAILRNQHQGPETFLHDALHTILASGHRFVRLSTLAERFQPLAVGTVPGGAASQPSASPTG